MAIHIPDEVRALTSTVREFVEQVCWPAEIEIERSDAIPERLMAAAREMGLFGLNIPEDFGGAGLGALSIGLVFEELGRVTGGFASILSGHNSIGTTGIVELGTPEQRRRYLPRMATGEWVGAFALTEPGAGSDAAAITTRAERRGDRWVLNGEKCFITNALLANVITVIAVTDPGQGIQGLSAFIVERDFSGLQVGRVEPTMGLRGSHIAQLIFDNLEVPAENMLGQRGDGYRAAMRILTKGRASLCARFVGAMSRILDVCVDHAQNRRTFGQSLAQHQLIQAHLADMQVDLAASKALTYLTAARVDRQQDVTLEAALTKLFVSEAYGRVADRGVQIFGGSGYIRESPVERYYRDARVGRIYEGTSEIQRLIIARRVLAGQRPEIPFTS